jgi:hypothetical protein
MMEGCWLVAWLMSDEEEEETRSKKESYPSSLFWCSSSSHVTKNLMEIK